MPETIHLISPIDGSLFARRTCETYDRAVELVARARESQRAWTSRSIKERAELIRRGVAALSRVNDEVVTELAWMIGRPTRFAGEIGGVQERVQVLTEMAEVALSTMVVENTSRFRREIRREPQGVVLVIAPWNYPYLTAINTLVPALLAGNAVVLKHSPQSFIAGDRLVQAFVSGGVPSDVLQHLVIDHDTAEALVRERLFDFVSFTGSVRGGQALERAAAGTFVPLNLELGGKDAAYVMEDADLPAAALSLVDGAMFNSGQCCCGIERIYVAAPVYDAFVEASVVAANSYILGNPLEEATTLGPMAHNRFADVVRNHISEAVAGGAQTCVSSSSFPAADGGTYVAPQILVGVNHDMRVMQEETFGPVVGIMRVGSDDEAAELINKTPFGLTTSIWTGDEERFFRVSDKVDAGTIYMNRCDYLDPALCWSGRKQSGRGSALSIFGYQALSRPKSYHVKRGNP